MATGRPSSDATKRSLNDLSAKPDSVRSAAGAPWSTSSTSASSGGNGPRTSDRADAVTAPYWRSAGPRASSNGPASCVTCRGSVRASGPDVDSSSRVSDSGWSVGETTTAASPITTTPHHPGGATRASSVQTNSMPGEESAAGAHAKSRHIAITRSSGGGPSTQPVSWMGRAGACTSSVRTSRERSWAAVVQAVASATRRRAMTFRHSVSSAPSKIDSTRASTK